MSCNTDFGVTALRPPIPTTLRGRGGDFAHGETSGFPRAYRGDSAFRPQVILGPPGCGKTTTLLSQFGAELEAGTPPERIALVTFTRAASSHALGRLCDRFALALRKLAWVRTIHSASYSLLGLRPEQVMGNVGWRDFAERYGYELGVRPGSVEEGPSTPYAAVSRGRDGILASAFEWGRNALLGPEETLARYPVEGLMARQFRLFVQRLEAFKVEHRLVDFADMLERVLEQRLRPTVDVAMIDEAHDLSPLQIALVEMWFAPCRRTIVAGDDDQAIYKFQGADPGWLLELARRSIPEVLTQSRRVPARVHALAQRIIRANRTRIEKVYEPRDEPGEVLEIDPDRAMGLVDGSRSTFVLVRNRRFMGRFAKALVERAVPFEVEGRGAWSPYSNADLVAASRMACRISVGNPGPYPRKDVAALLSFVPVASGLIPRGLKAMFARTESDESEDDVPEEPDSESSSPSPSYSLEGLDFQLDIGRLVDLIQERGPVAGLIKASRGDREYIRKLVERYGNVPEPRVTLTTIHASKGREADLVLVVPDMSRLTYEEYVSKGQSGHEAETRVFYVAVTRAKQTLVLVQPRTRRHFRFPGLGARVQEADRG